MNHDKNFSGDGQCKDPPSVLSVPASVAKHTPTPWELSSSLYVVSRMGRVVAKCDGMGVVDLDVPHEQMFANAARIVACVNACEGIGSERLRPGFVKALDEENAGRVDDTDALRAQRDELAAALRTLVTDVTDHLRNETLNCEVCRDSVVEARAALAKVQP